MPVLGRSSTGSTTKQFTPGNAKATSKFVLADAAWLKQCAFYSVNARSSNSWRFVVYADSAGEPGSLLYTSQEVVGITTQWNVADLDPWIHLEPGTYWLGIITSGTAFDTLLQSGSGQTRRNSDTYSDGPTATFGTATADTEELPIYAVYEIGAANAIGDAYTSSLGIEAATIHSADALVSTVAIEALSSHAAVARVSGVWVEVLRSVSTDPNAGQRKRGWLFVVT